MFFYVLKSKKLINILIWLIILFFVYLLLINSGLTESIGANITKNENYIKWVSFDIPYPVLKKAMNIDIKSENRGGYKHNWIEILAYLGAKYGGKFSRYKDIDMDSFVQRLEQGETVYDITKDMKYYNFYIEAYTAVLREYVGYYKIGIKDKEGNVKWEDKYGLKVFSPIAAGYAYTDYDDFGVSRDYGFKRKHLGHDMMGSLGTPIIAIESGTIEAVGWNRYGGWRIGIRSFDRKRYYYYAHLRKDKPYIENLEEGMIVKAGDVIGYMGRTGYSIKENINNIDTTHLHLGIQLIFDESQKEGINQIWIDCYQIAQLLKQNRSEVKRSENGKDLKRIHEFYEENLNE